MIIGNDSVMAASECIADILCKFRDGVITLDDAQKYFREELHVFTIVRAIGYQCPKIKVEMEQVCCCKEDIESYRRDAAMYEICIRGKVNESKSICDVFNIKSNLIDSPLINLPATKETYDRMSTDILLRLLNIPDENASVLIVNDALIGQCM